MVRTTILILQIFNQVRLHNRIVTSSDVKILKGMFIDLAALHWFQNGRIHSSEPSQLSSVIMIRFINYYYRLLEFKFNNLR